MMLVSRAPVRRAQARRSETLRTYARAIAWLSACLALTVTAAAWAGELTVTVLQADQRPLPGAVITVHPVGAALPPAAPVQAVMDQVDLAFSPDLLVIPVGSSVIFPNTDKVSHEVYSFSPVHPFQLPLYRGKPYPPEVFNRTGVVTLGCNIHDAMLSFIVVTDAPFFGRTSSKGVWVQGDLPAGRYRISLWHPRLREADPIEQEFVVTAGHVDAVMHIAHALRPAPLSGKPHSWDAY